MRTYEVMYIIRPTVEAEQVKGLIQSFNELFTNFQSEVVEKKEMGLKDLAYEIDHHKKGYYVWLKVKANNEAIAEFNRVIGITEDVIRHIVVKEGE
jgi:small subunit ribosomal protein S6